LFRPVVRTILLTGKAEHYLRGDVSRGRDGVSQASDTPLWWPPTKIAGRYLSPYLASMESDASVAAESMEGTRT
jgi:sulfide:quinone oxidoreductase